MSEILIPSSYFIDDADGISDDGTDVLVRCRRGDNLIILTPVSDENIHINFGAQKFEQIVNLAQKNGLITLPEIPKAATSFNHGGLWAIVELMGHTRIAGLVTEEEHFGAKMGRIEIPKPDGGGFTTQWFSGSSVYRITPTTEQIVMGMAKSSQTRPVSSWELSLPSSTEPISPHSHEEGDDDDDYSPL